jgi:hypothetical protein
VKLVQFISRIDVFGKAVNPVYFVVPGATDDRK